MDCPFCPPALNPENIVLVNAHCLFILKHETVLIGSGLIVPKAHRVNVFELSVEEWASMYSLLHEVKQLLDQKFAPQGYNLGWNSGQVAGQEVFHAHLHVIPRYADEPLAGKGIRYWLKQTMNSRVQGHRQG
ncbi:MAG: HIT family protein [Chloroflexi bacterium HGW-Chloroflexi-7]|nr:MAG: HIT family protein [Chloroflexi bacterium HGW-Chloroflexi-7]